MTNNFTHTAIVFNQYGLGHADEALRLKLATNYLRTLVELGQHPQAILFYADGVRLVTDGSPCLTELAVLSNAGVPLIVCRTCLDHFGLAEKVKAGVIGGMGDILAAQAMAAKVVTL